MNFFLDGNKKIIVAGYKLGLSKFHRYYTSVVKVCIKF